MRILVTGFEAFGKDSVNASLEVVRRLPDEVAGWGLQKVELPVSFSRAPTIAIETIERISPDVVICLGQAPRSAVSLERVAINVMDAKAPDNDGFRPVDEPLIAQAPAAYFSTLPIKRMATAIHEAGIPANVSNSAGTYVCNALMYHILCYAAQHCPGLPAGFIHLPGQQANDISVEALMVAIKSL